MFLYVILIIIILLVIILLAFYNSFRRMDNKVKEAFSTMDVYLKKRYDLIPNLVSITKGYAKYESETLENIVKERSYSSIPDGEKLETNENITDGINKLLAVAEAYPDLKANDNFKKLSDNLVQVEDEIANARKYYNAVIRLYNNKVEMFPSNIFAKLFGYKTKEMFEADSKDRESVRVDLNEENK